MRFTIASADALKARKGAPASPDRSAAIPTARATTTICSALKPRLVAAAPSCSLVEAVRPNTLAGTRPVRKSSQPPVVRGVSAAEAETAAPTPGCSTVPRAKPMTTAISAVTANHSSVRHTRPAAF
jgi:hypothetical protein